jgi:hypothetical protein
MTRLSVPDMISAGTRIRRAEYLGRPGSRASLVQSRYLGMLASGR